jgi:hypothetical protein
VATTKWAHSFFNPFTVIRFTLESLTVYQTQVLLLEPRVANDDNNKSIQDQRPNDRSNKEEESKHTTLETKKISKNDIKGRKQTSSATN